MKKYMFSNVVFVLFLLMLSWIFIPNMKRSIIKLNKLDEDIKILSTRAETLQLQIEAYKKRTDDMNDEFQREKVARNKLQMIKEHEEIYRFINKKQEEL